MRPPSRLHVLSIPTPLVLAALLALGGCGDASPAAAPSTADPSPTSTATDAVTATTTAAQVPASEPPAAGSKRAVTSARQVVRHINAEHPARARRHATRAAVRRMVDLHEQGFDFTRPKRCRGSGDSRLCRSDLVVPSGGGTSSNLRLRAVGGAWTVTGVEGLD